MLCYRSCTFLLHTIRRFALIGSLTIGVLLSACGKSPDAALLRMHNRMVEKITMNAASVDRPSIASLSTNISVHILPIAGVFAGQASVDISTQQEHDASDPKNVLLNFHILSRVDIDAPGGTFQTFPANAPQSVRSTREHISVNVIATAKADGHILAINVLDFNVSAPLLLPVPFSIPAEMAKRWYGATYDQINAELKKQQSKADSASRSRTIQELLQNMTVSSTLKTGSLKKTLKNVHFWRGVQLLPSKDGMTQIRVESDPAKLQKSLDVLLTAVQQSKDSSWKQLENTVDIRRNMLDSIKKQLRDARVHSLRGILSADEKTYDFRGFDGEILSDSGEILGTIQASLAANGDIYVTYSEMNHPKRALAFEYASGSFILSIGGNETLRGTVTKDRLTATATDPTTHVVVAQIDLAFGEITKTQFTVKSGTVILPPANVTVTIDLLHAETSEEGKNMSASLKGTAAYKGRQVANFSLSTDHQALPSLFVEVPTSYAPFSSLQSDMMSAVMQKLQPIAPATR